MKICVVGIGYVGLSIACLLAHTHEVTAVDVHQARVDMLNAGTSPLRDDDIERVLAEGLPCLSATTDLAAGCSGANFAVIAVPTDYDAELNHFDTSIVESVLDQLEALDFQGTVVIRSTVPVGFTQEQATKHPALRILFSPEFLREGQALYDNLHPSRIVVGVPAQSVAKQPDSAQDDSAGLELSESLDAQDQFASSLSHAAEIFTQLLADAAKEPHVEQRIMGSSEAEAIKLFSNTYLALRVAFFNELDTYAQTHGLNTRDIIDGVGLDSRIGNYYNNPSFGYGGYCLPKDSKQLLSSFGEDPHTVVQAVVQSNAERKDFIAQQIAMRVSKISPRQQPALVGIYRLAMKKGSDNYRQSAMLGIMERLADRGVSMLVYDPACPEAEVVGSPVTDDLEDFKSRCALIVCNRYDFALEDVVDKVFTRDLGF